MPDGAPHPVPAFPGARRHRAAAAPSDRGDGAHGARRVAGVRGARPPPGGRAALAGRVPAHPGGGATGACDPACPHRAPTPRRGHHRRRGPGGADAAGGAADGLPPRCSDGPSTRSSTGSSWATRSPSCRTRPGRWALATAVVLGVGAVVAMALAGPRLGGVAGRRRAARSAPSRCWAPRGWPASPSARRSSSRCRWPRGAPRPGVPHRLQVPWTVAPATVPRPGRGPGPVRAPPGADLLAGLAGKDVVLTFVESYGRSAVESPEFAPSSTPSSTTAPAGWRPPGSRPAAPSSPPRRRAGAAGWPTPPCCPGCGSPTSRATAPGRSDRLTLKGLPARRLGHRRRHAGPHLRVARGRFFGFDRLYDSRNLGYRGPSFTGFQTPDQYTLSAFERLERAKPGHAPLMAEIPLVTSHCPWAPVPRLSLGRRRRRLGLRPDGRGRRPDEASGSDARIRDEYRRSIEYSLASLVSYVETYGDDDLVLVVLGDHQPAAYRRGEGAGRDVPITIVARDPAVLDRIAGWGWHDGLAPARTRRSGRWTPSATGSWLRSGRAGNPPAEPTPSSRTASSSLICSRPRGSGLAMLQRMKLLDDERNAIDLLTTPFTSASAPRSAHRRVRVRTRCPAGLWRSGRRRRHRGTHGRHDRRGRAG